MGAYDTSAKRFSIFGISCENFSEADKVMEKMKAIDVVQSVRMRVVKGIIVIQDWLRNQVAKRLSRKPEKSSTHAYASATIFTTFVLAEWTHLSSVDAKSFFDELFPVSSYKCLNRRIKAFLVESMLKNREFLCGVF